MPRGKFTNHKGRNRRFTNPEELEAERRKEEATNKWRKQHGYPSDEEEDEEEKAEAAGDKQKSGSDDSSSDEETDSEDGQNSKAKGVSNLIEIENPNRVQKKSKKLNALNNTELPTDKPQLSRREREEIEKQRAAAHYQKLHAEGKTEQARADLARLAIIKQQREEAARIREKEKEDKEKAQKMKAAQTQKALGKKV